MMKQQFPPGWTEKKIRAVIAHYDQQTEDEAAAEIASAPEAPGETWMSVPTELVGAVTQLIKNHEHKGAAGRSRMPKKKSRTSRAGK
jgi:hypothetical protein